MEKYAMRLSLIGGGMARSVSRTMRIVAEDRQLF
jgi:hypothetical protein